jgi:hypothetical protein
VTTRITSASKSTSRSSTSGASRLKRAIICASVFDFIITSSSLPQQRACLQNYIVGISNSESVCHFLPGQLFQLLWQALRIAGRLHQGERGRLVGETLLLDAAIAKLELDPRAASNVLRRGEVEVRINPGEAIEKSVGRRLQEAVARRKRNRAPRGGRFSVDA